MNDNNNTSYSSNSDALNLLSTLSTSSSNSLSSSSNLPPKKKLKVELKKDKSEENNINLKDILSILSNHNLILEIYPSSYFVRSFLNGSKEVQVNIIEDWDNVLQIISPLTKDLNEAKQILFSNSHSNRIVVLLEFETIDQLIETGSEWILSKKYSLIEKQKLEKLYSNGNLIIVKKISCSSISANKNIYK